MTKQRDLKKQVRARMAQTGESYTTARTVLLEDSKPREPGCKCHLEEGDSPCPVHGGEARCLTEYGECVLPRGHRSDEHGDDHQGPDGWWWNVGRTTLGGAVNQRGTPGSAPIPKPEGPSLSQLRAQLGQAEIVAQTDLHLEPQEAAIPKCERCGTVMADGGSVGFYCPKKDCLPEKPKLNAMAMMRKAFLAWGVNMHPDGKLIAPDGRELKVKWSAGNADDILSDLKAFHGIDAEVELARAVMNEVFVALFGEDSKPPKPPEVLWRGQGSQAVFAPDAFERELMAGAKEMAPKPEEDIHLRAKLAGPTPTTLKFDYETRERYLELLGTPDGVDLKPDPSCICGTELGGNANCLFHHPPVVDTVLATKASVDVAQKLVDRAVANHASGERSIMTVDTGDLSPDEATRVVTGMKTRFSAALAGTGPFVKPPWGKLGLCVVCGKNVTCECKAAPEGTTYARCTNPKCAKVYSMRPTESRRCEHCGHTPVEVLDPDAEFEPRGGFLTAKEPWRHEVAAEVRSRPGFKEWLAREQATLTPSTVTPLHCLCPLQDGAIQSCPYHHPETLLEPRGRKASAEGVMYGDPTRSFDKPLPPSGLDKLPPVPVADLVPILEALKYINGGDAHADEAREEAAEALELFDKKHPNVLTALHDPRDDEDFNPEEPVECIVNGKTTSLPREANYRAAVQAAGYDGERILSVTYRAKSGKWKREGTLSPGRTVEVLPGMIFNVADTSSA